MSKKISVILIKDVYDIIDTAGNVRCLIKPFTAISVARLFNNEKLEDIRVDKENMGLSFTAEGAKILVVDDNFINLKVARGLMDPYKMDITTLQNAKQAIEEIQNQQFDLIFMDHMMPEMDGIEAVTIIRAMEDDYCINVPIIALTANAVNGAKEMFAEVGFSDFIAKPIEVDVLDKILRKWLPKKYVKTFNNEMQGNALASIAENICIDCSEYIDISAGLKYAGNREEMYFEVLQSYIEKGQEKIDSLDNMLKMKDWHNYTINVHALKSTSKTIGAVKLSELAAMLENAGKTGEYSIIESEHMQMIELFMRVLDAGESLLQENGYTIDVSDVIEITDFKDIEKDKLVEYIKNIYEYCDIFDSEEIENTAKELYLYIYNEVELSKYFKKIAKYASNFKYSEVVEVLDELVNELELEIIREE